MKLFNTEALMFWFSDRYRFCQSLMIRQLPGPPGLGMTLRNGIGGLTAFTDKLYPVAPRHTLSPHQLALTVSQGEWVHSRRQVGPVSPWCAAESGLPRVNPPLRTDSQPEPSLVPAGWLCWSKPGVGGHVWCVPAGSKVVQGTLGSLEETARKPALE